MMKFLNKYILLGFLTIFALLSFTLVSETTNYKCMIQMTNYNGEGAYVVVSLLKPDGSYDKTLYVNGNDDEWYFDISEWFNFYGKKRTNIDAITGESITGGQRAMCIIEVENNKIDKGYKLRFETAVEDQEYYKDDVELELSNGEQLSKKNEGKGFIRYVRIIAQ